MPTGHLARTLHDRLDRRCVWRDRALAGMERDCRAVSLRVTVDLLGGVSGNFGVHHPSAGHAGGGVRLLDRLACGTLII